MPKQSDEKKVQDAQWQELQALWRRRGRLNESGWADLYRLIKDFLSIEQEKFSLLPGNFPEKFEFYVQRFFNHLVRDPALRKDFSAHDLTSPDNLWDIFKDFNLINDYWQRQDYLKKNEWDSFYYLIGDILTKTKDKKIQGNIAHFDNFFADRIVIPVRKISSEEIVTKAYFQTMFKNYLADLFRAERNDIAGKKDIGEKEKKNDLIISMIVDIIYFKKTHPDLPDTDWKPLPRHERMAMEVEKFQQKKSKSEKFNLSNAISLAMNYVNQLTPEEQSIFNEYFIESKSLDNPKTILILENIYNKAGKAGIKLRKKISKRKKEIEENDSDYDDQIINILDPAWEPPKEIERWLMDNRFDLSTIRASATNFFNQLTTEEQLLIKEHIIGKKPLDHLQGRVRNVYGKAAKLGIHLRKNEKTYDKYSKTSIGQWLMQSPDDNPSGLGLSQINIEKIAPDLLPPIVGTDIDLEKIPDIHPEEIEDEIEKEVLFMIVFQILPACALDGVDAERRSGSGSDDPSSDA